MNRRTLLLSSVALVTFPLIASAQQLSLDEISGYLNTLRTATGEFTQINPDGSISTGTIYIKRPGRMRFEYNPPERALVIAGGGSLAVFDPGSNNSPERYPLSETPLKIILARNVNFAQERMIIGHTSDGTTTTVTAQDPENPEYGNIQLMFTGSPLELRQWIITDNTGAQTTVILGDLSAGGRVPDRLFNILAATREWQN